MKLVRNLLIVLIFTALVCGGAGMFYYSNDYRYSYTDISVNEPASYTSENEELADIFKRILKVSEEESDLSVIALRTPQFYITTHIGGKNQRTYDIYITSVMTRSAYIHDTKTGKLYKMSPSAFVVFLQREELANLAYSYTEPCEMTLERDGIEITGKAAVCDWNYVTADGSYVKVTETPNAELITGNAKGSPNPFTVSLPYGTSSIKARVYTEDEEILFEGDISDGVLPCANMDGSIYYEITAVWKVDLTKDFYGTAQYTFKIENDVPVNVTAEKFSCYQGEFIRLFAENANDGDVYTAECAELKYSSTFAETENGLISLLPIPCDAAPGIYTINITENGASKTLEIEVKEQSFERGTLTISTETTPEAEAELEEFLSPLRSHISETEYAGGKFSAPVEGKITTSFGLHSYAEGSETYTVHNGLDIAAQGNPPITAAQSGVVVFAGELEITGKTVVIDHGLNILSYYYHMKNTNVELGQTVNAGDTIGNMGKTGYSTGDHLHYTVMINGVATNPTTLYDVDPSAKKIK